MSENGNPQMLRTAKINDLCRILDCSVSEVLEYIPDDN